MTVFGTVILPNIASRGSPPARCSAFITSWDEITVTLFITSPAVVTLPRRIWTRIADSIDPALAAIAAVLLLATMTVLIVQRLLAGRGQDARDRRPISPIHLIIEKGIPMSQAPQ